MIHQNCIYFELHKVVAMLIWTSDKKLVIIRFGQKLNFYFKKTFQNAKPLEQSWVGTILVNWNHCGGQYTIIKVHLQKLHVIFAFC